MTKPLTKKLPRHPYVIIYERLGRMDEAISVAVETGTCNCLDLNYLLNSTKQIIDIFESANDKEIIEIRDEFYRLNETFGLVYINCKCVNRLYIY